MVKVILKTVGRALDKLSTGAYILLALAILVVINWFTHRNNQRLDLTPSQQYSLSLQTERVLENLEQEDRNVDLYVFDREQNFPRHKQLLDIYASISPRVTTHSINPDKKPALAQQMDVERYGTLVVKMGDRQQEASDTTEEAITNTLIQLLKGGERTVCFLKAHGERDIEESRRNGFSRVKDLLENGNYKVRSISLLEGKQMKVPEDCTLVIVAGPKNDYLQGEIEAIRSYIEKGGRGLFMLDPRKIPSLTGLLEDWKVTVQDTLVVDPNPVARLFGADELMPLVQRYESHVIVRDLQNVATLFPSTRTLEIVSDGKEGIRVEPLFKSSEQSLAAANPRPGQPIRIREGEATPGPFTLGVAGTIENPQSGNKDPGGNGKSETSEQAKAKSEGRFVVMGTSTFATNSIINFGGNRDLFLNVVNWLSRDEDLISIRPKPPDTQRLDLNEAQMGYIRLTLFLMPICILGAGFVVWFIRL